MRPMLDLGSLVVPVPAVELRYRYEPGLRLLYRSVMGVLRVSDASPAHCTRAHEQFTSAVLLRVIAQDPADQGFFVLSYQAPIEHLIDEQPAETGAPRIVYLKHNPLGELIEASDASEGATLLLPPERVGADSSWTLVQQFDAPGSEAPLELLSHYCLDKLDGDLAYLSFESDEIRYQGATPLTEGHVYTLRGRGSFTFDVRQGHLVSLETESTLLQKEQELLLEVVSTHKMTLAREEDLVPGRLPGLASVYGASE